VVIVRWLIFFVLNATFNNITVISWWSVLLVEETGGPGENYRPVAIYWHYIMLYTSPWSRFEIQTDITIPSTKCLCNLNLCKPNTCLSWTNFSVPKGSGLDRFYYIKFSIAVYPVEWGRRFTHMFKTFTWSYHFNKREIWGHTICLIPTILVGVVVTKTGKWMVVYKYAGCIYVASVSVIFQLNCLTVLTASYALFVVSFLFIENLSVIIFWCIPVLVHAVCNGFLVSIIEIQVCMKANYNCKGKIKDKTSKIWISIFYCA
jgi:hypothetical protein